MRLNQNTAISTSRVLLVPYDRHHVTRYHQWMEDPLIQEATASEPLTLEEEYENQVSWRESPDKLTFIICQPVDTPLSSDLKTVAAGEVDTPQNMVGDINFFLYPWDEDDPEEANDDDDTTGKSGVTYCAGEVDIMIAGHGDRGKGMGRAAVSAFLRYIHDHLEAVLEEYASDKDMGVMKLKVLMAKIKESNVKSISLFKALGFAQKGEVNYFGEITMVLDDLSRISRMPVEAYREIAYTRPTS